MSFFGRMSRLNTLSIRNLLDLEILRSGVSSDSTFLGIATTFLEQWIAAVRRLGITTPNICLWSKYLRQRA